MDNLPETYDEAVLKKTKLTEKDHYVVIKKLSFLLNQTPLSITTKRNCFFLLKLLHNQLPFREPVHHYYTLPLFVEQL